MEKDINRFVPVKELEKLILEKREITKKINSYPDHCWICGDTKPKHGFYPLWGITVDPAITSGWICNRCSYNDEEYKRIFKEPKEKI